MTHCPPGNPKTTRGQAIGLIMALFVGLTVYAAAIWWAAS